MQICSLFVVAALTGILTSNCQAQGTRPVDRTLPDDAERVLWGEMQGVAAAYRKGTALWLEVEQGKKEVVIPRLAAPVRGADWLRNEAQQQVAKVELRPEPTSWKIVFGDAAAAGDVLRLELGAPVRLLEELEPIQSQADGSFFLPASSARTVGEKLRYEPQPFKNTVGYWTDVSDRAEWQLELTQPGKFNVEILQGCGAGQGGSRAKLRVLTSSETTEVSPTEVSPTATLEFDVEETGHFQNFRWRHLGELSLESVGTLRVEVLPVEIRRAALMDIRAVHLIRLPQS